MPIPWGVALAANAAGGLLANRSRSGQAQKDRDFQQRESALNRQYQTAESDKQMGFQERMRNTEWQAGVADMQAAGINPALAYSQGGASAPMGARGSGAQGSGSRANQEDMLTPAVSSALQYARAAAEIKKLNAETAQISGRVTRAFEPAVSTTQQAVDDLMKGRVFNMRTARIIGYEMGSSARSIMEALRNKFRLRTIGPNTTPRRR